MTSIDPAPPLVSSLPMGTTHVRAFMVKVMAGTQHMQARFPLVRENAGSVRPRFVQTRQCTRDNSTPGGIVSDNLMPA
jgi:hypothetical protein